METPVARLAGASIETCKACLIAFESASVAVNRSGMALSLLSALGLLQSRPWAELPSAQRKATLTAISETRSGLEEILGRKRAEFEAVFLADVMATVTEIISALRVLQMSFGDLIHRVEIDQIDLGEPEVSNSDARRRISEAVEYHEFDLAVLARRDSLGYALLSADDFNIDNRSEIEALVEGLDRQLREVLPHLMVEFSRRGELVDAPFQLDSPEFWWRKATLRGRQ